MADKETTRLCIQIIRDHFGSVTSRVAAELLGRGRLRLADILRATRMRPKVIANALLVLIQHNIVWYCEPEAVGQQFEINWNEILHRLRFGRYLSVARELFNEEGYDIVHLVMHHGKVRAGDVVPYFAEPTDMKRQPRYRNALISLLNSQYLKPTAPVLQTSPGDRYLHYQKDAERRKASAPNAKKGTISAKDRMEINQEASKRLRDEVRSIERGGFKRRANDLSIKESKGVNEEACLRLNASKFDIHIRNHLIVASAAERYNASAGVVMRSILSAAAMSESTCTDVRSEPFSVQMVLQSLPASSTLNGIAIKVKGTSEQIRAAYAKEYINVLCATDNPTTAGHASAFAAFTDGANSSSMSQRRIQVEYEMIAKLMRKDVYLTFVRQAYGSYAVRIVNILLEKGKTDEKAIARSAMLSPKDVQSLLPKLSSSALISLQEVPRSSERSASKTIYLWFVCGSTKHLFNSLKVPYKSLTNMHIRLFTESSTPTISALLEKRERSDVRGREEELMTRDEREALQEYERKKERLRVLMGRVDESVFVMKDFCPTAGVGVEGL
ncbi:RNA polymerase III subunit RPC82 helix-turn-helix domain-containing protein [Cantharellus anzutake]|uniref:RNA polymerase III subunit RPC82 helix-turn-helix domain-containing protein n=1 Tax=Cantharellus anzutake TaxID=1750568 RepID=UPI0019073FAA|nr:RNA polymerase III subunit RPC82 helix-turn-helix domain-containing protein [Cantharellus anzutake]KAF8319501.1 RNA polymerase III subunit RPC82 helix-turn-helix domain-containing protein [Cantharellus anzutake]